MTDSQQGDQAVSDDKVEILHFDHDPIQMVKDAVEKVGDERMRAAVVVFVDQQGKLMWDGAGYTKMELLWALERFKMGILSDD